MNAIADALARRRALSLHRERAVVDGPQGVEPIVDGRPLLSFCSNDYLGLANHPAVVAAMADGARRYGAGSGASHLISGHSRAHHALEEALAAFTGYPRALIFSTGYMANLAVPAALLGRGDAAVQDRLNHASLIDGAVLSRARLLRYAHRDVDAAGRQLARLPAGRSALIASDGVFSMDGDVAPVAGLAALAAAHGAWLMIDDAHGLGVIGQHGRGTLELCGCRPGDVPLLVGTLGKALGTGGAFVAGDHEVIEFLIQTARPYIYTTALPPAVAHATLTSLRLVEEEEWRRTRLFTLIDRLRAGLRELGLPPTAARTPIQPIVVGDATKAAALSASLREAGLLIPAIRPPTVPQGSARLRVTLSAAHRNGHVDRLLDELARRL